MSKNVHFSPGLPNSFPDAIRKIEDAKMCPIGFNYVGYVYHALGDLDSYFEYMNKAFEAHTITPSTLIFSPLLARARADPRYLGLVERVRRWMA